MNTLVEPTNSAPSSWDKIKSIIAIIASALGLLGAVLFMATYFAVIQFYAPLSVEPSDVGFTYSFTLINSVAADIPTLFVAAGIPAVLLGAYFLFKRILSRQGTPIKPFPKNGLVVGVAIGIFVAILLSYFWAAAFQTRDSADAVMRGRPVIPPPGRRFFISGGRGALPAIVKPVNKPTSDAETIKALRGRYLLYLGQADGVAVLYDVRARSAIYLPTPSVVIKVTNCRDEGSAHPACRNAYSPGSRT